VKEFRLQVRPVHWVEFRDLALQPRTPLPRLGAYTFGPVVERTFDELIDFDTGRTAGFPPGKPGTHPFEGIGEDVLWAQEQGFDAVAGLGELQVLNVVFAVLKNSDWDTLTPEEVQQRLYQGQYAPKLLKPAEPDGLPATFAFRTREGGIGVLQLVALDDQRPGASVRIKRLVRPGAKPATAQARRDPRTGELVARLAQGGTVALVAIRPAEAKADAWRRADGDAAPGLDCTVEYPQPLSAVAARRFDLLFRVQDVPEAAGPPGFEFPRAIRSAAGGRASVRGAGEESLLPVQVVWPETERLASARVGIPRAGWHTIRSFEPVSRSFTKTRLGEDPNWEIEMHAAGDGTLGAQVTVVFGRAYPDWNLRVTAVRSRAADVPGVVDARVSNGPTTTTTYVFPGLKLAEVQNFQVQVQPLEWVEFAGLQLERAQDTARP
jgi:hypothetical protein